MYYAVRKGRKEGIFKTWEECKSHTSGFKGAEFKKFMTENEANEYLGRPKVKIEGLEGNITKIYVDGSFGDGKGCGYGVVILKPGLEEPILIKGKVLSDAISMRNVAGELKGAMKAMKFALDNEIDTIALHYDYKGIEKWATGEWKTKNEWTKSYKEFYQNIKCDLNVLFVKVKAHSGDEYNDLADSLAKSAIGL